MRAQTMFHGFVVDFQGLKWSAQRLPRYYWGNLCFLGDSVKSRFQEVMLDVVRSILGQVSLLNSI